MSEGRKIWLLLLAEALATALDLVWGAGRHLYMEELYNWRAGLLLACGHWESVWTLQYRPFCGGCTAEAVVAAPLLRLLGDGLWAWKLVPAGFHLLGVGAGAALLGRSGGAAGWLLVVLAAPPFHRALALTGFGNHAEVGGLCLLATLLVASGEGQVAGRRWGLGLAGGAVAGLSLWFAYSAAWLPVALLGLAGRRSLPWLLGLPLGLLPALLWGRSSPDQLGPVVQMWASLEPAPLARLPGWLLWDGLRGGARWALPGAALWPLVLVLGLLGLGLPAPERAQALQRWARLGLLAFLAATLLRFDLWDDNPEVRGWDPFNLRYRAPLWPLLAVGMALLGLREGRLRWALLLPVALGLGLRAAEWWAPEAEPPARYPAGQLADPTLPSGQPLQRRLESRRRPVDVAAGEAWLRGHADPLEACAAEHRAELEWRRGAERPRLELPP